MERRLTGEARNPTMTETQDLGSIPPIARKTLHDEVVERLRDLIIEGRLAPGTRINEVQVAKRSRPWPARGSSRMCRRAAP